MLVLRLEGSRGVRRVRVRVVSRSTYIFRCSPHYPRHLQRYRLAEIAEAIFRNCRTRRRGFLLQLHLSGIEARFDARTSLFRFGLSEPIDPMFLRSFFVRNADSGRNMNSTVFLTGTIFSWRVLFRGFCDSGFAPMFIWTVASRSSFCLLEGGLEEERDGWSKNWNSGRWWGWTLLGDDFQHVPCRFSVAVEVLINRLPARRVLRWVNNSGSLLDICMDRVVNVLMWKYVVGLGVLSYFSKLFSNYAMGFVCLSTLCWYKEGTFFNTFLKYCSLILKVIVHFSKK